MSRRVSQAWSRRETLSTGRHSLLRSRVLLQKNSHPSIYHGQNIASFQSWSLPYVTDPMSMRYGRRWRYSFSKYDWSGFVAVWRREQLLSTARMQSCWFSKEAVVKVLFLEGSWDNDERAQRKEESNSINLFGCPTNEYAIQSSTLTSYVLRHCNKQS